MFTAPGTQEPRACPKCFWKPGMPLLLGFQLGKLPSTINSTSLFLVELGNRNRLCHRIVIIAQDLVNLFFPVPFFFFFKKLPFTIPELVQASPCRSSDGILYMGKSSCFHWHFELWNELKWAPEPGKVVCLKERCAVTPSPTLLGKVFLASVTLVHARISWSIKKGFPPLGNRRDTINMVTHLTSF